VHALPAVLDGDLDEIVDALTVADRTEQLETSA
jgi:protein subunit release factor A